MSFAQSFSDSYHYNRVADDSSTVFDADTVMPDEVPSSSPPMPPLPMPTLTATATTTDYHHQQPNNYENISSTSTQEKSPANTISELLRRINSRHRPAEPSTTTAAATATRTEEISTNESSSSSSSKKRSSITNSSSNSSRKKTRRSSTWNKRFNELKNYKEKYGRTNVPARWKDNKQLGKWASLQRSEYKKFKKNEKSYMTSDRIELLESIGFQWECRPGPNQVTPRNESAWNKRFNELKNYKEKHKNTNVPKRWKDNKELGRWVNTQRTQYKLFKANDKKSYMTSERIEMLNSIGFQWEVCLGRPACS